VSSGQAGREISTAWHIVRDVYILAKGMRARESDATESLLCVLPVSCLGGRVYAMLYSLVTGLSRTVEDSSRFQTCDLERA
jgi:hypothetical protein